MVEHPDADGVDRSDWSDEEREYEQLVGLYYVSGLSPAVVTRMLRLEKSLGLETLVPSEWDHLR